MTFSESLWRLWPNGDQIIPGLRTGIVETAPAAFQKHGINTPLLIAHVMAQISHECGAGHDVVENLSYSSNRLIEVWPHHFNSSNAAEYAHNPQKLANFIYNPPQHNDLGNRAGSNDGWSYRGRGASQTTGRAGYARLADATGLDLLNNPDLVNDSNNFMECGVADFIICGCLPCAKADDVVGVTKKLNGGTVGLLERKMWLARWKSALGAEVPSVVLPFPVPDTPDIHKPEPKPIEPPTNLWTLILSIIRAIFGKK
jgi:putative chitinase